MLSTTHHSLEIDAWEGLPGGVRVGNWADCEDGTPSLMLLLRDRKEVSDFVRELLKALDESENKKECACVLRVAIPGISNGYMEGRENCPVHSVLYLATKEI